MRSLECGRTFTIEIEGLNVALHHIYRDPNEGAKPPSQLQKSLAVTLRPPSQILRQMW